MQNFSSNFLILDAKIFSSIFVQFFSSIFFLLEIFFVSLHFL